jgi:two-component system cell cycle response regulator DivK
MSKCILVVEDQEDNRRILRDLLGNAGFELIEAETGEDALAAVKARRPDLILMDIQLPQMDGYEATRRIKSNPEMKEVPVIAVTSYALAGDDGRRRAALPTSASLSVRARCSRRYVNIWRSSA